MKQFRLLWSCDVFKTIIHFLKNNITYYNNELFFKLTDAIS